MHSFNFKIIRPAAWVIFTTLLLVIFSSSSWAQLKPKLLVLGVDSNADTVPRTNPVFDRVSHAIRNQMLDMGLDVYDEKMLTSDEHIDWNNRMSDADLIDIVRSISSQTINVVVLYEIFTHVEEMPHIHKVSARVHGRLLNIGTKEQLGSFAGKSPAQWTVPVQCSRACYIDKVGKYNEILARDLGAVLAEILESWTDPNSGGLDTQYALFFDYFSADTVYNIEEHIRQQKFGVIDGEPIIADGKSRLYLRSNLKANVLREKLGLVLSNLGLSSSIRSARNSITIQNRNVVH